MTIEVRHVIYGISANGKTLQNIGQTEPYLIKEGVPTTLNKKVTIPGNEIERIIKTDVTNSNFALIFSMVDPGFLGRDMKDKEFLLDAVPYKHPVTFQIIDEPRPGHWGDATFAKLNITVQQQILPVSGTKLEDRLVPTSLEDQMEDWWAKPENTYEFWITAKTETENLFKKNGLLTNTPLPENTKPLLEKIREDVELSINKKNYAKELRVALRIMASGVFKLKVLRFFRQIKAEDLPTNLEVAGESIEDYAKARWAERAATKAIEDADEKVQKLKKKLKN